jgi:hypothetical protein
MMQVEVKRVAPGGRIRAGNSAQGRRGYGVKHDAGDPMPESHPVTFGRVVEQRRGEQVAVVLPAPEQPFGNVEAVATIGNRHRFEEGHATFGQDPAHQRRLLGLHARPNVGDELPDPMHR